MSAKSYSMQLILKSQNPTLNSSCRNLRASKKKTLACPWRIICIINLGKDFVSHGSYLYLTFPGTWFLTFINMFCYHGYILIVIIVPMIFLWRKHQGKNLNGLESMHVIANLKNLYMVFPHKQQFCMSFETNKKRWKMYIYLRVCIMKLNELSELSLSWNVSCILKQLAFEQLWTVCVDILPPFHLQWQLSSFTQKRERWNSIMHCFSPSKVLV